MNNHNLAVHHDALRMGLDGLEQFAPHTQRHEPQLPRAVAQPDDPVLERLVEHLVFRLDGPRVVAVENGERFAADLGADACKGVLDLGAGVFEAVTEGIGLDEVGVEAVDLVADFWG